MPKIIDFTAPEVVTSSVSNDGWVCPCNNDDFAFVTADGAEVEPTEAEWPVPLYACNACGRIVDQDTLRPNPDATDEYDSHIVSVVRGPGPITHKD